MALCAGYLEHAEEIISDARAQLSPVAVLDDVLAPAMHRIGEMWEHEELTIAEEHVATSVTRRLLKTMSAALEVAPARSRERILLATSAAEQHTTGLLMAKAVLFGAGYDTIVMTAGLSDAELCAELRRHEPAAVAFSLTMPDEGAFDVTAAMVHETLPGTQLIVGGSASGLLSGRVQAHRIARLDGLLAALDFLLTPVPS